MNPCEQTGPFLPWTPRLLFVLTLLGLLECHAADTAMLEVVPSEIAPLIVHLGANPAQTEVTFVVSNPGRRALRWSVSANADWVSLSNTSGLLLPNQEALVICRLQGTTHLPIGRHVAEIIFSERSRRTVSQLRRLVLLVRLPAPILLSQPAFTRGNTNMLSWTAVSGANEYELEKSRTADFSNPISSGWMPYTTNFTHTNLIDGETYFYRVRCRSNRWVWSQTLAREFALNKNLKVTSVTSPGDLVLVGDTNRLWFEDFDEPGTAWCDTLFTDDSGFPPDPSFARGPQGAHQLAPDTLPPLPINQGDDQEGRLGPTIAVHRYAYMPDESQNRLRDVTVDAYIAIPTQRPYNWMEAGVVLRGRPSAATVYPGGNGYAAIIVAGDDDGGFIRLDKMSRGILTPIDLTVERGFSARIAQANLRLRMSAVGEQITVQLWQVIATNGVVVESPVVFENGTTYLTARDTSYDAGVVGLTGLAWANGTLFDNSVFYEDVTIKAHEVSPCYAASGSTISPLIVPPSWFDGWGTLTYTASTPVPGTKLQVDVLDSENRALALGVTNGADLNAIAKVASQRAIRLRARLSTSDPLQTPALSDWTVTFPALGPNVTASVWSETVSSTQDATPPLLVVNEPADNPVFTTNAVVKFSGMAWDDISGVRRVRVGTNVASTVNDYTNWTVDVPVPRVGTNSLIVLASDFTTNSTIILWQIVYEPGGFLATADKPAPDEGALSPEGPSSVKATDLNPELRIQHIEGGFVVSWSRPLSNSVLQIATSLWPPNWTNLPVGATNSVRIPADASAKFFRLFLP